MSKLKIGLDVKEQEKVDWLKGYAVCPSCGTAMKLTEIPKRRKPPKASLVKDGKIKVKRKN